jgi:hypothetical protein
MEIGRVITAFYRNQTINQVRDLEDSNKERLAPKANKNLEDKIPYDYTKNRKMRNGIIKTKITYSPRGTIVMIVSEPLLDLTG